MSMLKNVLHTLATLFLLFQAMTQVVVAAEPAPGEALYLARCASCHSVADGTSAQRLEKAPSLDEMRQMSADRVFFSMLSGMMKSQAAGLGYPEMGAITMFASAGTQPGFVPETASMCTDRDIDLQPVVAGWGFDDRSTRSLGTQQTTLSEKNISSLRLKWAFALPGTSELRSQPVVTTDTLFAGASSGHVFALDRFTGCVKWHTATPLRTSLTLGQLQQDGVQRAALFFGDSSGSVTALDAASGKVIWRVGVGLFDATMLTGAVVQHGAVLIVPISSAEVGLAADPAYECCRTHGGVRALDANTGAVLWTHHMTADAEKTTKSSSDVQLWGPSGVPVWATPTIDAGRGVVYVGTGENYSSPTSDRSDSIVALDLKTGAERWAFQAHTGDAYNTACDQVPPGPNCPKENGPDFDFGAAVVITTDSRGRELLLAGQKSGDVYALDPDAAGKVVWHRQLGAGSKLGGVHWGIAVAEGRVYVPIADPPFPIPGYEPKPGVHALSLDDGKVLWEHPLERGCTTDLMTYFQRDKLYPDCSFYFGPSAAPTVLPGVLVIGGLDGRIRALDSRTGAELWTFETVKEFVTVNGIAGHGGSIDAGGAIAAGNMLYIQSGYSQFAQLPGNVLLGFEAQ